MPNALKLVALDFGHTLMDERRDSDLPLAIRPITLMPGAVTAVSNISLPLALWANTRVATETDLRVWLSRADLSQFFISVITSVDARARKPDAEFFRYALASVGLSAGDVLFVGNQLNTDIAGASASGIRTVWLAGQSYRSDDDGPSDVQPTYVIDRLDELPELVQRLVTQTAR